MKKFLSLFFGVCLIIGALTGCSQNTNVPEPPKTAQGSSEEAAETPEPATPQEPTKPQSKAEEPKTESRGIQGSYYIDPRVGLEERGFPKKSLGKSEVMDCRTYENIRDDANTGIRYSVSLFIEKDNTIISAIFETINLKPLETEDFIKASTNYLHYCASVPYDTMNADKVRKWIEENIDKVDSAEKGASIIIGDAEFTLYGTKAPSGIAGTRLLEIRKVDE